MRNIQISNYESSYRKYSIPSLNDKLEKNAVDATQVQKLELEIQDGNLKSEAIEENQVVRKIRPDECSLQFNRGEDYSYIGKNKDLSNLDMEKAISDMKKDSMLQQYNFFVGRSKNLANGNSIALQDGIVIPKFDI